jgi:hypothetical protein
MARLPAKMEYALLVPYALLAYIFRIIAERYFS